MCTQNGMPWAWWLRQVFVPPKRPAYSLWTVLIARIYKVIPLLCHGFLLR